MASSAIETAGLLIGKVLLQEVQYLAEVSDKVEELQSELEWMQCFLWDADEKQNKNALLRKWLSEIRDSALEAEDVIEGYLLKVDVKRQNKGVWSDIKWLTCCWRNAVGLHDVGLAIDALTAKLAKMSARLDKYGVKSSYINVGNNTKLIAEQRRTYAHVDEKDPVGLDQCVDDVAHELRRGTNKIVLLHGMGGIGKTTLARAVFKSCKEQFHGLAWAYISQQLQLGAVCRGILLQLIPKNDREKREHVEKLEDSLLPEELCEMLKQNKYLVVLDDIWFTTDWGRLEPAFPVRDTRCHSKVLVTARDPLLLSSLRPGLVFDYPVKLLDHDTSWKLLGDKANFQKENLDHTKLDLGSKMLDHCNGHPLAIVVLGGVLVTKKSVAEWESIGDNLPSYLQGDESFMGGVYEVLAMSYYVLPYNIKPCFLHLGHFPEDNEIPVQKLYHIWIAEGIVSSTEDRKVVKNSSLEDICEVYMNELVQKGMVIVGSKSAHGKITTVRLHDLMRDKCLEMNREENFVQIVGHNEAYVREEQPTSLVTTPNEKHRRMTIYADNPSDVLDSFSGKNLFSVRSLMFFHSKNERNQGIPVGKCIAIICKDFQLLRVLDFEDLPLTGSIAAEVGSLVFLRHLSVKGTQINDLPSSIEKLRSLVILDLRVIGVTISIPNEIWKLKALRHLYFPSRQLSQEGYPRQNYLIKDNQKLKLDQLSHLEKLEDVDLDRVYIEGLVELRNMRKLHASCISEKRSLQPFLKSKSIKSLSLKIHAKFIVADPMLLSGCDFLKVLHIDAPRWQYIYLPMVSKMYPHNLVQLGFWYCIFEEDPMPMLETLVKLKSLELRLCYSGRELNCSENAFPELTYLMIDGLFQLRRWKVKMGGFPKLAKVEIYNSFIQHLPKVLSPQVDIACSPCVKGIERHGTCPFFKER